MVVDAVRVFNLSVIGDAVQIVGRVEGMKSAQPLAWICDGLTDAEIRAELEAERFRRAA